MSVTPREAGAIAGAVVGLAAVQVLWLVAWAAVILGATIGWLFAAAAWRAVFG